MMATGDPVRHANAMLFPPSRILHAFTRNLSRASLVAVHKAGLIDFEQAARAAAAIDLVAAEEDGTTWNDYLDFEERLIERIGPEASLVHLGRSRQDIFSTIVHARIRDGALRLVDALEALRTVVLDLAETHLDTVVPGYTHGVQAQPTTYAQMLLAFEEALARSTDRLVAAYVRANRSPLGAGAMTTSSFALDRHLLARMLGFDSVSENAFGANHVAAQDVVLEVGAAASIAMTQIVQFVQDVFAVQALAHPWVRLRVGALTGISSMMPQKRNPSALESVRELAAAAVGRTGALLLSAHNLTSGMPDLRETSIAQLPIEEAATALALTRAIIIDLEVDPALALAECAADWSTMTDVADMLYVRHRVPFRIGHEFASALTGHGRASGLTPAQVDYQVADRLYEALAGESLPLTAEEFATVIDPVHFVATRAGLGGPQRPETERLLREARVALAGHSEWSRTVRMRLAGSAEELAVCFTALCEVEGGQPTVEARTISSGEKSS